MLMLLGDARLPTGAHTQSAGAEPAMRAGGVTIGGLPSYIAARLDTVTAVEAGAAVVARHVLMHTSDQDERFAALTAVDRAWRARTMSAAIRSASVLAARGYFRLLSRLWPERPEVAAVRRLREPGRAVVLGAAAVLGGLSSAQLVRLVANDDVATIAAAALKIEPVDPVLTTGWIVGAHPQIEAMAAALAALTTPEDIPALSAPLIEEWAEVHAASTQRLFRA
jgi:urease accessory protein